MLTLVNFLLLYKHEIGGHIETTLQPFAYKLESKFCMHLI